MTPSVDTRSARSPGSNRSGPRRVAMGEERAGAPGEQGQAEQAAADAGMSFDWETFAEPPATRRSHPAELLYAMFERMGGMPSSHWKGKYVNLVI